MNATLFPLLLLNNVLALPTLKDAVPEAPLVPDSVLALERMQAK
jgi:hypothetical protein